MKKAELITKLYYNYGKTPDSKILDILNKIELINNGLYLAHNQQSAIKIAPRGVSILYDRPTGERIFLPMYDKKIITYLVKSSSRFTLKPDIGEIIDQIEINDLYNSKFFGIMFDSKYKILPETEGEHFLMKATLLFNK